MPRFVGRRLVLSILTLLLASGLVFFATEVLPGDVATAVLGRDASPAAVEAVREKLELSRPAPERYAAWVGAAVQGDLGVSLTDGEPIKQLVAIHARNTLLLAGIAALVGIPIALGLGLMAGVRRDTSTDLASSIGALIALSLPEYVMGTLLILVFAVWIPVLPAIATVPADVPISELLRYLPLPALTASTVMIAYTMRMMRTSTVEVAASPYAQMAQINGASRSTMLRRHIFPNAILPTLNVIGLTLGWLVGGVVVIESVFNYPGVGKLMVEAVSQRDVPLVQALALLGAAVYIVVNLAADVAGMMIDPRLRDAHGH